MERVAPSTVILFVGKSSRDKPTPETLKLLEGRALLRTDERGNIEMLLDGDSVQLQTQK